MSDGESKVLTETWRDKRFENDLTKSYFAVSDVIAKARRYPCLEYIKDAHTAAKKFINDMIYSKVHLKSRKEHVNAIMDDIELILFGDPMNYEVVAKAMEYGVRLISVHGKPGVVGGVLLMKIIEDKVFLVKQWAYASGIFFPTPLERKFGLEAIEEGFGEM